MHQETFIDGVWYPSVTTVLGCREKPWLDKWYEKWGNLAARKVAASNAIGTEFHRAIESRINGFPWAVRYPRVIAMLDRWSEWADSVNAVVDHTELHVVRRECQLTGGEGPCLHYSGTLDAVGTLDGIPTIFDWKTSSGIYPDMALQLSAYANAYEEMTGTRCRRGLIVLVSKDKPKHRLTVKEYKLGGQLFGQFLDRLDEFRAVAIQPGSQS